MGGSSCKECLFINESFIIFYFCIDFIESQCYNLQEIKKKKNLKIELSKIRLSIKDKFKILFDALEIEFNELEKITWEFRNYSAHANKTKNREEDLKFIKSKDLFKTLLNRVILKLSGLDVKYVDYYSVSVNEYKSKELSKGIES